MAIECSVCGKPSSEHDHCFPCPAPRGKSVADGRTGDFPRLHSPPPRVAPAGGTGTGALLIVVSHCPRCMAPIYGPKSVGVNETPAVKFTCACHAPPPAAPAAKQITLADTTRTT